VARAAVLELSHKPADFVAASWNCRCLAFYDEDGIQKVEQRDSLIIPKGEIEFVSSGSI
jgi:hypothetical protein